MMPLKHYTGNFDSLKLVLNDKFYVDDEEAIGEDSKSELHTKAHAEP